MTKNNKKWYAYERQSHYSLDKPSITIAANCIFFNSALANRNAFSKCLLFIKPITLWISKLFSTNFCFPSNKKGRENPALNKALS